MQNNNKHSNKSGWRKFLRTLSFVFIFVFLVLVALAILIQLDSGRSMIANLIAKKFSAPGRELRIHGVHRGVLNSIQVDSLSIADTDGTWLKVDDIHVNYDWREIINGKLNVELLAINHIKISRTPIRGEKKPTDSKSKKSYLGYLQLAQQIVVSNIVADTSGLHIAGNIEVAAGKEYSGELDVAIDDIATLGKIAGASATGKVETSTSFVYSDGKQSLQMKVTCNELSVDDTTSVSNLMADIAIDDIYCVSNVDLKLSCESAQRKKLKLNHLNIKMTSGNGVMDIYSDIKGRWIEPFSLCTTGTMTFAESKLNLDAATKRANISGTDAGNLAVDLTAPLPWMSKSVSPEEDTAIAVKVAFDTKMYALSHLPIFVNNIVKGTLKGQISYNKKGSDVAVSGGCNFNDGYYENYISGTVIDKINVELKGDGSEINIASGNARDSDSGEISISGSLDLKSFKERLLDLKFNLRHFTMLNRDDLQALVSGEIQFKGTGSDLSLTGALDIDEGRLNLNNLPPALPPVLIDNTSNKNETHITKKTNKTQKRLLKIEIALKTTGPFYFIGQGLSSIWAADLRFIGDENGLGLKGEVESRSGSFLFLSRKFILDRGQISFDNNWPPSPILNIVTIHERADLSARMHISGRVDNPKITMDSIPSMPEDEVFSHIIFGKNLSNISTLQAFQVASAMQGMRTGNNIDFMQNTKNFWGFDRLGFGTAEDKTDGGGELTTIAVGKYLTEGLYTEINTPLGVGSDTKVTAEYELYPNLTIETEAGINMRPGMGINWKKDY